MGKVSYRRSSIVDEFWNVENVWNIWTEKNEAEEATVQNLH